MSHFRTTKYYLYCIWSNTGCTCIYFRGVILVFVFAVYEELYATRMFETMSIQTDEDEHSIEMHLPYIAKCMERYRHLKYCESALNVTLLCYTMCSTYLCWIQYQRYHPFRWQKDKASRGQKMLIVYDFHKLQSSRWLHYNTCAGWLADSRQRTEVWPHFCQVPRRPWKPFCDLIWFLPLGLVPLFFRTCTGLCLTIQLLPLR